MPNSSIWPFDRSLSGATTPSQRGPESNGNEGALIISQSSSITGASPSNCLVSYPRHSLGGSYASAEIQSVYSTAPADWANHSSKWPFISVITHLRLVYKTKQSLVNSCNLMFGRFLKQVNPCWFILCRSQFNNYCLQSCKIQKLS